MLLTLVWAQPKPEVSLTLIPPSPVTDRIMLDIRGAVRNEGLGTNRFTVSVYLDSAWRWNCLHRETLEVGPGSAAGFKFRWPTKGRAGNHTFIMVAEGGGKKLRSERPIKIVASEMRSTGVIGGTWSGIYHWSEQEGRLWNADIKKLTDDQWREQVRGMHSIGMDIIVLQESFRNQKYVDKHAIEKEGYQGLAFYPSGLYPGRMPIAARDPLEAIYAEADALGMQVFAGVGLYAWFDFTEGSLAWHKNVADELWERYGHHDSFYGWYVSGEIAGNLGVDDRHREELVSFFRGFGAHVRKFAPDKPVMLASNSHGIREAKGYYAKLLPHLDILCPFGFHRMSHRDLTGEEAAELLQRYCDEAGSHLWMDMEVFLFGPGGALLPRPISGLVSDAQRFPNFEKILCYQYPGLLNTPEASLKPGGEPTVKLYQDYKNFLEHGEAILKHAATGKPVKLGTSFAPQYKGGGEAALTDGRIGSDDYRDPAWQGYAGCDLDAVIDLKGSVRLQTVNIGFLHDVQGGIYLPRQVECAVSEDGRYFAVVETMELRVPQTTPLREVLVAELKDVRARYLRIRAKNIGRIPAGQPGAGTPAWLFADELVLNAKNK
jgi:hypothetical protein